VKRLKLIGHGRRVGAIGISEPFVIYIEAQDEADARLKVYDFWEHITSLYVVEVRDPL